MLFSLSALSSFGGEEQLVEIAFRATVDRFKLEGEAARRYGLFRARFLQAAEWYHEQRAYRQTEMLRSASQSALLALGLKPTDDDLDALDRAWQSNLTTRFRVREGAVELLEALRAEGVRSALVVNADCEQFGQLLEATGLRERLDVTICSEEAGSCKPDPFIYYEALRRLHCRPSEALFVGTSPETDIRGARLIGMRAALVAAESERRDQAHGEADHLVATLHEVRNLVTRPAPAGGPRVRRRVSRHVPALAHP